MLLDRYAETGRLFNSNFVEETAAKGCFAYRGDLILVGDFDSPANARRPPSLVMTQVALIADPTKILGLSGALEHLSSLEHVLGVYGPDLAEGAVLLLFVRDVPAPLTLTIDTRTIHLQPYEDTLVWNDLLDVLSIEKSDLKKLSPADKVEIVVEAARGFRSRAPLVDWAGALDRRVEKAPLDRVGAI